MFVITGIRDAETDVIKRSSFSEMSGGSKGLPFYDGGYAYGYGYSGYERRTFTCTVRYDGRITKFKTKRLRC